VCQSVHSFVLVCVFAWTLQQCFSICKPWPHATHKHTSCPIYSRNTSFDIRDKRRKCQPSVYFDFQQSLNDILPIGRPTPNNQWPRQHIQQVDNGIDFQWAFRGHHSVKCTCIMFTRRFRWQLRSCSELENITGHSLHDTGHLEVKSSCYELLYLLGVRTLPIIRHLKCNVSFQRKGLLLRFSKVLPNCITF
jgi:hypothetical protein